MPSKRRLITALLVAPIVLALTAYIIIQTQQVTYAVLWPGLTSGSTYTIKSTKSASWAYYAGFGKMTISFSGGTVSNVYVAVLPIYTLASQGNLSLVPEPTATSHGTYLPCGRYGLIAHGSVVIPVSVQMYDEIYVYVPIDATVVPMSCYQTWSSYVSGKYILTFDGTRHTISGSNIYVKAYRYNPSTNSLASTSYLLYSTSSAVAYNPNAVYGDYGDTDTDGVWYFALVSLYVGRFLGTVTITLTAQS